MDNTREKRACGGCRSAMPDQTDVISRIAHESDMARMERTIHRLWIANIIVIALLFVACAGFAYYESQFEDVNTAAQTVTQDTGDGNGNITFDGDFIGGDFNGKADGNQDGD